MKRLSGQGIGLTLDRMGWVVYACLPDRMAFDRTGRQDVRRTDTVGTFVCTMYDAVER